MVGLGVICALLLVCFCTLLNNLFRLLFVCCYTAFFIVSFLQTLCIVVAITINYFYLVAFGWMLMEGVMLYLKLVKVFNVATSTKVFYVVAWGKNINKLL